MKCEDLLPLQGAYLDSELDAKTSLEIQQHLATCPDCARSFSADANLEARIVGSLKRGQRTAALWEQIEQRITTAAGAESRPRRTERSSIPVTWWRELLWPNPQAWAGLAALWVMMLVISLFAHEPATVAGAQKATQPSPQLRQLLREQKQMLAELGGVAEQLGAERPGRVAPQPRSQKREQLINI